jgi:hypothetical protein
VPLASGARVRLLPDCLVGDALSPGLAQRNFAPTYDRGRVTEDLATRLAGPWAGDRRLRVAAAPGPAAEAVVLAWGGH